MVTSIFNILLGGTTTDELELDKLELCTLEELDVLELSELELELDDIELDDDELSGAVELELLTATLDELTLDELAVVLLSSLPPHPLNSATPTHRILKCLIMIAFPIIILFSRFVYLFYLSLIPSPNSYKRVTGTHDQSNVS